MDINQLALKVAAYQSRITVLEAQVVLLQAKIKYIIDNSYALG